MVYRIYRKTPVPRHGWHSGHRLVAIAYSPKYQHTITLFPVPVPVLKQFINHISHNSQTMNSICLLLYC